MNHSFSAPALAVSDTVKELTELSDAERQPCEVWTRVMGYHRPVASFNIGKQGEHNERRFFCRTAQCRLSPCA